MDKRISDLIKLAKLNKDVKLKNKEQEWQKAGLEYTLQKFHKPVTERIERTELTRKKELKAISDQLNTRLVFVGNIHSVGIRTDRKKTIHNQPRH
ncbi:hypothetical protein TNCT_399681 [Trichonephila clavata]|uniref:Uncharacterized protein n=1 Tax=Trichonephila clavata TaxID=2740835 RepID=A0A8X6HMB7_TRICU|nr:hypothetical protein TNCT_399681 [Trichonephila clavata]